MHLRPALATDQTTIERIIRAAHINPMDLRWERFVVSEEDGQVIGTGQVKTHGDGSREIASIAVIPDFQHRGVASAIIRELLARERGTVYLFCRASLESFYERFGFHRIGPDEMSPYFRRMHKLANALGVFVRDQVPVIVMKRSE